MRREDIPDNRPGALPLFESLEQRLLLSAVPFVDDLSDAYALAAQPAAIIQAENLKAHVNALAVKHAAGELQQGEDKIVTEFGTIFFDPIPTDILASEEVDVQESPVSDGDLPATPGAASYDLADTFLLHSNPTATKTL